MWGATSLLSVAPVRVCVSLRCDRSLRLACAPTHTGIQSLPRLSPHLYLTRGERRAVASDARAVIAAAAAAAAAPCSASQPSGKWGLSGRAHEHT